MSGWNLKEITHCFVLIGIMIGLMGLSDYESMKGVRILYLYMAV